MPRQERLQRHRTARPMRQEPTETQQRQVGNMRQHALLHLLIVSLTHRHAQPSPYRRGAQANQAEHGLREWVRFAPGVFAAFVRDVEAILFPGPVEERDETVVEQVEPLAQSMTFLALRLA